ncbi:hypothetical protein HAX54_004884, partial [Datura stramonium]|nr:hypothetical protein [Datura stramonium]
MEPIKRISRGFSMFLEGKNSYFSWSIGPSKKRKTVTKEEEALGRAGVVPNSPSNSSPGLCRGSGFIELVTSLFVEEWGEHTTPKASSDIRGSIVPDEDLKKIRGLMSIVTPRLGG